MHTVYIAGVSQVEVSVPCIWHKCILFTLQHTPATLMFAFNAVDQHCTITCVAVFLICLHVTVCIVHMSACVCRDVFGD